MADKKISELDAVTTPLAGTEVLPVVQSSSTKKVTAEQLFNTTQPSGNANGVVYLNSSKVANTSSTFVYNPSGNSTLGINTSTITPIYGKTVQLGDGSANNTISMVGPTSSGFISNFQSKYIFLARTNTTVAIGTNETEKLTIDLNGNTSLLTGNLVIGTADKGIDFSANTNAAGMTSELLNDYEEGTFTPTVLGTSVFGTATYSYQVGKYTRIGNEVFFSASLAWTGHTGSGNIAGLYGLPFTSASTANNYAPLAILVSDLPLTAGNILQAYVGSSTTVCSFRQAPTGGGSIAVVPLPVSCGLLSVSGHYYVT